MPVRRVSEFFLDLACSGWSATPKVSLLINNQRQRLDSQRQVAGTPSVSQKRDLGGH